VVVCVAVGVIWTWELGGSRSGSCVWLAGCWLEVRDTFFLELGWVGALVVCLLDRMCAVS
jgi:hypothetical protein